MDITEATDAVITATCAILDVDASAVHADTHFAEDLDADSLDLVEIAMQVEEATGIDIGEEDLADVHTVADAAALMVRVAAAA